LGRGAPEGYSPNLVEEEFSEVRLNGVLGSSQPMEQQRPT
jgi:hypothetical protein